MDEAELAYKMHDNPLYWADKYLELEAELATQKQVFRMLEQANGGSHITINQELAYYEDVPEGRRYAIQWYPYTPIGSYTVYGDTVEEVFAAALAAIGEKDE